jgi:hypothetical protein
VINSNASQLAISATHIILEIGSTNAGYKLSLITI